MKKAETQVAAAQASDEAALLIHLGFVSSGWSNNGYHLGVVAGQKPPEQYNAGTTAPAPGAAKPAAGEAPGPTDCSSFEFPATGFFHTLGSNGVADDLPKCHLVPQALTWSAPGDSGFQVSYNASPEVYASKEGAPMLYVTFFRGTSGEKYFFAQTTASGNVPEWARLPYTVVQKVEVTFTSGQSLELGNQGGAGTYSFAIPKGATGLRKLTVTLGLSTTSATLSWPAG